MKMNWKLTICTAAALAGIAFMSGCGGSGKDAQSTAASGKKTVVAATEGMVRPVSYVDKDGNLTGYEVAVLKAIGQELGYNIKFEKTEFTSMFAGVNSGRYQVGFGNLSKTAKRQEQFAFTSISHYYEPAGFFVTHGLLEKHPIHKIEDLGGLKTDTNSKGDSWQRFIEAFNAKFPDNPIKATYSDEDWGAYYKRLNSGEIDVIKGAESRTKIYSDEYGYHFDFVSLPQSELDRANGLAAPEQWFVFRKTKDGEALAAEFDKAITKLRDNGTLSKLSIEYLGRDYSSKANYEKDHQKS